MKKKTKKGTGVPILDIIHAAFNATARTKFIHTPDRPVGEGEKVIGEVTSPTTKYLMGAGFELTEELVVASHEHDKLHQSGDATEDGCNRFSSVEARLEKRAKWLGRFMWSTVYNSFPDTADDLAGAGLRSGWKIVVKDNGEFASPIGDLGHIADTFVFRVRDIAAGVVGATNGSPQKPVGNGEKVIGKVTDKRTQAIWALQDEFGEAVKKLLPLFVKDPVEAIAWVQSRTIRDLVKLSRFHKAIGRSSEIVSELFWLAVNDEIADVRNPKSSGIGVRSGWQVVELPPEDDDPIVIPVSGRQALEFLMMLSSMSRPSSN